MNYFKCAVNIFFFFTFSGCMQEYTPEGGPCPCPDGWKCCDEICIPDDHLCPGVEPKIVSQAQTNATEGETYTYNLNCTDADQEPLSLALGAGDTCGGAMADGGDGTGTYTFTPDETQGGSDCDVQVTCTDGLYTDTQITTVTVDEDNQAPTIVNLPATESGPSGHIDNYKVIAEDPDIPPNTITWNISDSSCTFSIVVDTTGLVTWTCGEEFEECAVDVTVTDDGLPPMTDTGTLAIGCVDNLPGFTTTAPNQATEDEEYLYEIGCVDPLGDPVSLGIGASDNCNGVLADNGDGTGTYAFTPDETQGGTQCVVHVTCTSTVSESQTTTVDIVEDNKQPEITNLPVTESGHWGLADSFDVNATDPDIPADVLTWSISGSTCSFTLSINILTGVVSWTCGGVETCTVNVTVTDDGTPEPFLSDSKTLTIQCTNTNPPVISSTAPASATEHERYSYSITCVDVEGDSLALAMGAEDTCGGALEDNGDGTGTYSWTPDEFQGGATCDVEVTCSDSQDADTQTTTVPVAEDNQAPSITNLPATMSAPLDSPGSYDVDATDPDIPDDVLTWSLGVDTCGFVPAIDSGTGVVSWTCGVEEICTAEVTVYDDGTPQPALSDINTLTIRCSTVNNPPEFTSMAPTIGIENMLYVYDMTCTDADSDVLTLAVGAGDTCGGSITDNDDGTGTYTFTPDDAQSGSSACDVHVTCSDTQDVATQTTTVTVIEINQAPSITNLPSTMSVTVYSPGSYDVDATDPDIPADVLTWSLGVDTCGFVPAIESGTGVVSWTCGGVETCTVYVMVADDGTPLPALSDTEALTIECTNIKKL